ncbi:MAG TPA: hypothetical protein H9867_03695 [Candidatus Corynebacterium gallistercoris]|uniref:Uncharacterized protein n=1 Tax=Candidatus Corynebacterium gallistercoris TaxID=2838530 RepID=A0A9D1RXS5_9CORY|nr:hypothetical protein [Candidatus Corynebacterium gallistercoris]
MHVVPSGEAYRDVDPMVDSTVAMTAEALQRSAVWQRMVDSSLPLMGRAAYLEQHWEGLRVLVQALETAGWAPELRAEMAEKVEALGGALDKAHATARWRDHHVTMPSMLQFRRRVNEMVESRDSVALDAHAIVRLAAVAACPIAGEPTAVSFPPVRSVHTEDQEEYFAEELSAAMLMVLAHGSDVCRSYPRQQRSTSCAVTAAAIRRALG